MSSRDIAIIDSDARIAAVNRAGTTWSVSCLVFPDPCERCGKPVGQKHQKRCRPGCEATR